MLSLTLRYVSNTPLALALGIDDEVYYVLHSTTLVFKFEIVYTDSKFAKTRPSLNQMFLLSEQAFYSKEMSDKFSLFLNQLELSNLS